jgi:hypothetical protein
VCICVCVCVYVFVYMCMCVCVGGDIEISRINSCRTYLSYRKTVMVLQGEGCSVTG